MSDGAPAIEIPDDELRFSYARGSGPGGQNVNKVNSKAVLRWNPSLSRAIDDGVRERFLRRYAPRIAADGDLIVTSDRHRDQARNADDCVDKLKAMIAAVIEPPTPRRPTRPTRGSKLRTLREKKAQSDKKKGRSGGWE